MEETDLEMITERIWIEIEIEGRTLMDNSRIEMVIIGRIMAEDKEGFRHREKIKRRGRVQKKFKRKWKKRQKRRNKRELLMKVNYRKGKLSAVRKIKKIVIGFLTEEGVKYRDGISS